jgi:carboxypeptidase C (cathepsin A)
LRSSCILGVIVALGAWLLSCGGALAQQSNARADFWRYDSNAKPPEKAVSSALVPSEEVVTRHHMTLAGQTLEYTATAGLLPIRNATTEATEGNCFFVYYRREGVSDRGKRPIIFLFNGGPGASASWLHMLAFGPKRAALGADGSVPPPPYAYSDNPNTLLDQADLVFVDPIGTGYSRASPMSEAGKFWGMENDVAATGEFIRLFLGRYNRWLSPKYVLGESYATYRAVELSSYLERRGTGLSGLVLISTLLEDASRDGDAGFANYLPEYATAAWFHKRLSPELQALTVEEVAQRAETFTTREYVPALFQGERLSKEDRDATAAHMAQLTGLSTSFIQAHDLRVELDEFRVELLRGQKKMVSRLDSRFTAFPIDTNAIKAPFDSAGESTSRLVNAVVLDYLSQDLGFKSDRIYYDDGSGIGGGDKWPGVRQGSGALEDAFARNPNLKVFLAEGYFDLATIYYGIENTMGHLRLSDDVRKSQIVTKRYASGHAIYSDQKALAELRKDLRAWF